MATIDIVQISDIHLKNEYQDEYNEVFSRISEEINNKKAGVSEVYKMDILFISGDLIDRNKIIKPAIVHDFINFLSDLNYGDNAAIIICPGNHEIDRDVVGKTPRKNEIIEAKHDHEKWKILANSETLVELIPKIFDKYEIGTLSRLRTELNERLKEKGKQSVELHFKHGWIDLNIKSTDIQIMNIDANWLHDFESNENRNLKELLVNKSAYSALSAYPINGFDEKEAKIKIVHCHYPPHYMYLEERFDYNSTSKFSLGNTFYNAHFYLCGHIHPNKKEIDKILKNGYKFGCYVLTSGGLHNYFKNHEPETDAESSIAKNTEQKTFYFQKVEVRTEHEGAEIEINRSLHPIFKSSEVTRDPKKTENIKTFLFESLNMQQEPISKKIKDHPDEIQNLVNQINQTYEKVVLGQPDVNPSLIEQELEEEFSRIIDLQKEREVKNLAILLAGELKLLALDYHICKLK